MNTNNHVTVGGPGGPASIKTAISQITPHRNKTKKKAFRRIMDEKTPKNALDKPWKELKKTALK